jgi:hypothetical protein
LISPLEEPEVVTPSSALALHYEAPLDEDDSSRFKAQFIEGNYLVKQEIFSG